MAVETGAGRANGLIEALLRPEAYPDPTSSVELRETHISWVFLTDHFAYKLKKPVRFEFVDFSTPETRYRACQDELRLNRRWTRGVYLDVVPIFGSPGGDVYVGTGSGRPIDWMVHMRRLPDSLRLDQRILQRTLTDAERDRLVRTLAELYRDLPPLAVEADEYRRRVEAHVRGNWEELRHAVGDLSELAVRRSQSQQWRWVRLFGDILADRARDGRIVDGHGDLRPDHVYLEDPLAIVDCVEFSEDLRKIDVLDDLVFLVMECQLLRERRLGAQLIDAYRRAAEDPFDRQLYWFYMAYRASVRAKVQWLKARQKPAVLDRPTLQQAAAYLAVADEAAENLLPPLLIMLRGVSGSGKSTLGKALAEELALQRVSTDEVRQAMFGASDHVHSWESGRYQPEYRRQVYDMLFSKAEELLTDRLSVLLDGTFLEASLCQRAEQLAREHGAEVLFVECQCDIETLRQRLKTRTPGRDAGSEADWQIARHQLELFQQIPSLPTTVIDTQASFPEQLEAVKTSLRRILAELRPRKDL